MQRSLFDFDRAELDALMASLDQPAYRVAQIRDWLFRQCEGDPLAMTNLPLSLREQIAAEVVPMMLTMHDMKESTDGSRKIVWRLSDEKEALIETVWMLSAERLTLCLSSQVGCALACTFCATGTMGLVRHLSAGEYFEQVVLLERQFGRRPDNLVLMGMGEPLHNREQLDRFLTMLADPDGYAFSLTRVTLSTAGMMEALLDFHRTFPSVNLAISLVSPFDDLRSEMMPINKRYPVATIAETIKEIEPSWGHRVTLEYPLLAGVNDRPEDVREIIRIFGGCKVKVNLIPYNATSHAEYSRPELAQIEMVQQGLQAAGIPAFIRWSKGQDVGAACGQLVT